MEKRALLILTKTILNKTLNILGMYNIDKKYISGILSITIDNILLIVLIS